MTTWYHRIPRANGAQFRCRGQGCLRALEASSLGQNTVSAFVPYMYDRLDSRWSRMITSSGNVCTRQESALCVCTRTHTHTDAGTHTHTGTTHNERYGCESFLRECRGGTTDRCSNRMGACSAGCVGMSKCRVVILLRKTCKIRHYWRLVLL